MGRYDMKFKDWLKEIEGYKWVPVWHKKRAADRGRRPYDKSWSFPQSKMDEVIAHIKRTRARVQIYHPDDGNDGQVGYWGFWMNAAWTASF